MLSKRFIINLVVLVVATGVALLAVDFGMALFWDAGRDPIPTKEFDHVLGWRLKPGSYQIRPRFTLGSLEVFHNAFGLRAPEFPPVPPTGTRRVLVFGDSFTYAKKLAAEKNFVSLLQKHLNERAVGTLEVLNAGVPGYGNAQELLLERRLTREYGVQADVFLLMMFTNDILDNLCLSYGERKREPLRPCFELDGAGTLFLRSLPVMDPTAFSDTLRPRAKKRLRLRILKMLKSRLEAYLQTKPGLVAALSRLGVKVKPSRIPGVLNGWYEENVIQEGVPLTRALLREMRDDAHRNRAKLLVAVLPSAFQVYPKTYRPILERFMKGDPRFQAWIEDPLRPQRMVAEMCAHLELGCLDLYPVLAERSKDKLFLPEDGHFTPLAHELVAAALADFVAQALQGASSAA